jgi:hypothetical protein
MKAAIGRCVRSIMDFLLAKVHMWVEKEAFP